MKTSSLLQIFIFLCINWYKYKNTTLKALIRHNTVHYIMSCNHIFTHNHISATDYIQINQNTWHISYKIIFFLCGMTDLCSPVIAVFWVSESYVHMSGRTPSLGDLPSTRPPHDNTSTEKIHTSMPQVGFKLIISLLDQQKTASALDRSATMIGHVKTMQTFNFCIPYAIMYLHEHRTHFHIPSHKTSHTWMIWL
jgi:hypothetical protein